MRNRYWVFGTNAGLRFSPNPAPFSNLPLNSFEACASISDINGNLILYSDGLKVMDGSGAIKILGLQGNQSSTQGALIVPDPANQKQYYIFTSDGCSGTNHHVSCILVDAVTWAWTNITLVPPALTVGYSPTEKLVAIRHANQQAFWVLTVVQPGMASGSCSGSGTLRVFHVDASGVTHAGDHSLGQNVEDVGYMKASLNGRRIALVNYGISNPSPNILVIPFSNASGTISLAGLMNISTMSVPPPHNAYFPYGVEFSQNGELLYYSTIYPFSTVSTPVTDSLVYQVSLPTGSKVLLGAHPRASGNGGIGALQYGSGGRIYMAQIDETRLGVIAHPDVPGPGCNLAFNALPLAAGSTCHAGLPNFIRELF